LYYGNVERSDAGRPFGSENFIRNMERKLDRRFLLKLPGRPRKKKGK